LNCLKQTTSDDTESNEQIPRKETPENQNAHVDANTNEHSAQGPDAQSTSPSSSSVKPSDSIPSVTNPVKIAKFSGNFVNGCGPVSVTYNENVMKLKLYFELVSSLFRYLFIYLFDLFILE
jgi:hypothetical protein